ncbi:MAG: alpha/beta hydrolase [Pseudomonadota bacterium]
MQSGRATGAVRLAVYEWGHPDHFPILCVHGLTGTGRDFDFIAPHLVAAGYRVLAPDLPGRGCSDRTTADGYRYQHYLHDLRCVLRFIGADTQGGCDWLGVSLGGLLGLHMAGMPQSPVRKLVLNDVGCGVNETDLDAIRRYLTMPHIYHDRETLKAIMIHNNKGPMRNAPMDDLHWEHRLDTRTVTLEDGQVTLAWDKAIAPWFDREPIGDQDYWDLWANTPQPTFVLRGEYSTILPVALVAEMAKRKPGATLDMVTFSDCGHVPPLFAPAQIQPVINWLTSH